MINRLPFKLIRSKLRSGKAIIILGARQTGKTTLLHQLLDKSADTLWLSGDDQDVQSLFEKITSSRLKSVFAGKKTIVIDEAQRIADIGIKLKLITDHLKGVQLIATGSSAFELANRINEPLTGRKWEFHLYPLSFGEMVDHHGLLEEKRLLPHRLVYGYYPEVVTRPGDEKSVLKQLSDSYLYKDILMWERIQKPEKLIRLMQALSFQVGNQVAYHELGQLTGLDHKTVEKYINLLEQVFVIFRLGSFSRNLRSELKSSRKIYFYDNGIRNALIANFNPPELRQDVGALWENFLMSERVKYLHYHNVWVNRFFWRTNAQQEVDYLEEHDGHLSGFEFKWNPHAKAKFSKTFSGAYPGSSEKVIHQDNFESFLLDE
jgi:predicted AAA+ superfamily ATPase